MSDHINDIRRFTGIREAATTDMAPMIELVREGRIIGVVQCVRVSRDDAVDILPLLVGGMNLDAVVLCMDAYYTRSPINPATGEPWGQGGMSAARASGDPTADALINDALNVIERHRDGRHSQVTAPYSVTDNGVYWHTDLRHFDEGDGNNFEGLIVDALRDAFERPAMDASVLQKGVDELGGGLSLKEARIHADCAVVKAIASMYPDLHMFMFSPRDQVEADVLQRSFADNTNLMVQP